MSFSSGHSPPPSPLPVPLPFSSSPSLTCCPELNLSVTLGLPPKTSQSLPKPRKLKQSQQSEQAQLKHNPKGQTDRKRNRQVCSKEAVITVTPEPDIDSSGDAPFQDWLRGLRHVVEPPAPTSTHDLSCLERAELNSTLALKTRLQSLQEAQFDSQRAIQQTLQKSESTKNRINARATEEVNVSRSQLLFTSLVSVDVQEDQLITQLLQDKLLLAPPSQCCGRRNTKGPSSLFFITSDLLRQKPLSPEEVPFSRKLSTSACPAHSTFDLYRRQRSWETTP